MNNILIKDISLLPSNCDTILLDGVLRKKERGMNISICRKKNTTHNINNFTRINNPNPTTPTRLAQG